MARRGAPLGNQFWKVRSKSGYDPKFTDPAKLWAAACEYFEWCDKNPLWSTEFNGKDAIECHVPKMRAYTMGGLFLFLGVNHSYFSDAKERLNKLKAPTKSDKEMLFTIERIEQTVFVQKFEGAAAGFLNANIIARELGLVDKQAQDLDAKHEIVVKYERKNRPNAQ